MTVRLDLGGHGLGGSAPLFVIAGPCVMESLELLLETARFLQKTTATLGVGFAFKSSYDKANRTSVNSFRGPGLEQGLEWLETVRQETGALLVTDVHSPAEAERAAATVDIIQIPAFLSRQTDLLQTAARTGKTVNVKKGQFLSPWDAGHVIEKITSAGGEKIIITERGSSFGYQNLVVDMRSFSIMRDFGFPVVFDATHSVQLPGGGQGCSSGDARFIAPLARAAVAAGVDGVFLEVHPRPEEARCDGPNSLRMDLFPSLLSQLRSIDLVAPKHVDSTPA